VLPPGVNRRPTFGRRFTVEVRNLSPDSLACLEQRLYRGSKFWPSLGQFRGAHGKHVHLCPADDEPKILEEPADLVLNIPLDLDEQSSADKKGSDRVTVEIFDADLLVPSTLHDACDAYGVRPVRHSAPLRLSMIARPMGGPRRFLES